MNFERETNPPRGGGRWYPTLVLLGDERVLAIGGASSSDSDYENNIMLEVFENGSPGKWIDQGRQSDVNFVGGSGDLDYPRAFLLPNGNVFVVHVYDGTIGFSHEWNPVSRAWRTYLNTPGPIYDYSPAVLLPLLPSLNYNARVLIAGGKSPKKIDLSLENPQWVDTSPRKLENAPLRLNSSAILLPDGKVLVVGGVPDKLHDESALASHTNVAELYDPSTDSWQNLAEANVIRNYHSVALLLPDGSVWTAGSNKNTDPSWKDDVGGVPNPKFDRRELRIEIYYPPYWKLIRPAISSIDNPSMSYNTPIRIFTSKTTSISSVALIRCSTATHALNPDQRFIGLVIHERDFESIIVNPPPSQNIAPPGYYMLFIIDDGNVPSPGKIVSLSA
jgi:hypothetical protein